MKWIGTTTTGNYLVEMEPDEWRFHLANRVAPVDNVAEALLQLRKERGLTQSEMARRIGISRNYYTQIESGRQVNYSHIIHENILAQLAIGCSS